MTTPSPTLNTPSGIAYNVLSSFLFAVLYAYTTLLSSLGGEAIYGWRILLTIPCLTVLVILCRAWPQVRHIWHRVRTERWFWASRILSSALVGTQLWLFMWAPVNGYGLDVSLGYFLLPLSMVLLGRIVFKDRISPLQFAACMLALAGIIYQLVVQQSLSWATLLVCLGYPGYFFLRKICRTDNLGGAWFDMSLSLPVSLYFVIQASTQASHGQTGPWLWLTILGLGAISAAALCFQTLSAPRLNMTLFGLLIYVEPVLLVFVALLLGERINPQEWPTYIAIWAAVIMLITEGVLSLRKRRLTLP